MAQRLDFRRIGLLVPSSSSAQEWDIGRALPDDITLHVARMRLSNVDAESTLRIVQEIETESQKLADVDVDVIIFPATAPSSRKGIGYDQELIKRITAASGKPATTASTALLEALRVLSVTQIALGAPWSASVNQTVAAFIEANGVEVLAQCEAHGCSHAVLRIGPGPRRRYCGTACASRTRVAVHRASQRTSGG